MNIIYRTSFNRKLRTMTSALLSGILFFPLSQAKAQSQKDTIGMIEKIFGRYQASNPGCQFSASINGKTFFSKAWGCADLEHGIPMNLETITEAGSVSKQFTAASILLLVKQGKLTLEDDIRKYITELPDYGKVIKIKNLIHHTSGIKDWGSIAVLNKMDRGSKVYDNEDVLEIILAQKTLNSAPGTFFQYSNSNYQLLTFVIERISGMNFCDYTAKYIFGPAGMNNTQWNDNFKRVVKNRAIAYSKSGTSYQADMPLENTYGAGGLLTTTEDLLKWNDFLWSGKLGGKDLLEMQIALDTFNNGVNNYYGAGLFIQKHKGSRVVQHTGASGAYRSFLGYYPDIKLSMAWLSNTSEYDNDTHEVINELEKLLLPKKTDRRLKIKKGKAVLISQDKIKLYQGWYCNMRSGEGKHLELIDGQLFFDGRIKLNPISNAQFQLDPENIISFTDKNSFRMINSDQDSIPYIRVLDPEHVNPRQYTGTYYSQETKSDMVIFMENGILKMKVNHHLIYPLVATYKDGFALKGLGANIIFDTNPADGQAMGFSISQSRSYNIQYRKIQ